jgi:hypothetical protein
MAGIRMRSPSAEGAFFVADGVAAREGVWVGVWVGVGLMVLDVLDGVVLVAA